MSRALSVRRTLGLVCLLVLVAPGLAGCLDERSADPDESAAAGSARFGVSERPGFDRGRAVVAVIDTGANPYHEEFRRPDRLPAPLLVPDYPQQARTLPLTLDAADLDAALAADGPLWDLLEDEVLYDVPGTAFAGLIAFGDAAPSPNAPQQAPGLDEAGHGTASAGMVAAQCPDCLIVAVEVASAERGRDALAWAALQEWIDIVVYPARSGIGFAGAGMYAQELDDVDMATWGKDNAEAGQVVVVAAGNGYQDLTQSGATAYSPARDVSYSYWTAGPDWVLTVGAAHEDRREATTWHTFPVDIVAEGVACDAPHPFSMTERVPFEGTSCSAPIVGGQVGAVLAATRDLLRDGATGPRSGQRLVVPDSIDAPVVTREDLTRAYLLTAGTLAASDAPVNVPDPTAPKTWSTGDGVLAPLYAGWGLHDDTTLQAAVDALTGAASAAAPSDEESEWFAVDQRIRLTLWGPWDRGESRIGFPEPFAGPVKVPEDAAGLEALYAATVAG